MWRMVLRVFILREALLRVSLSYKRASDSACNSGTGGTTSMKRDTRIREDTEMAMKKGKGGKGGKRGC